MIVFVMFVSIYSNKNDKFNYQYINTISLF